MGKTMTGQNLSAAFRFGVFFHNPWQVDSSLLFLRINWGEHILWTPPCIACLMLIMGQRLV